MSNTSSSFDSPSTQPAVVPVARQTPQSVDVAPAEKTDTAGAVSDVVDPSKTAFARDKEVWSKNKPTTLEYMMHAMEACGRSPLSLMWEYTKLSRQKGKISFPEYVQFGLYDPEMPFEHKLRFITNKQHWPITFKCCDMTWQATTEDKWLCTKILQGSSIAVPESLAVIDKTKRNYPGTPKIATADELREFALANQGQPFFGKENRGMVSFGVFLVLEADSDRMHLKGEGWIAYDKFMEQYVGDTSYLIQRCQKNHKFFDKYTDNLATVRVCILVTDDGIKIPFAVLKLPARDQIADSFWRPGNLACNIDPTNGQILDARTKNHLGTESFSNHPVCGEALVDEYLPEWDALLELVHECSLIFSPIRYQSMDVAITDEGPMLIEINTGGSFDLLQLAAGQGMLTDEVVKFFKSHGYRKF